MYLLILIQESPLDNIGPKSSKVRNGKDKRMYKGIPSWQCLIR